jgi:hypothetical protein
VGPAGAGKSTIAAAVCARDPRLLGPVGVWGLPFSVLLPSALRLVPVWVAGAVRGRAPSWDALAQMIRLEALRRVVDRASGERGAILLDEGPVFGLGYLEVFFPANGDRFARSWRERVLREWADRLDLVIVIDAANPVLEARIRSREKRHLVKHQEPAAIHAFSEHYRRVLSTLVEAMAAIGVSTWSVPTDAHSTHEAAALVSARLEHPARG